MKLLKKLNVFAIAAIFTLGSSMAIAGGDGKQKQEASDKEKLSKKSREVSGNVIMHKEVNLPGDAGKNLVVMIKTKKGDDRLVVDLGDVTSFKDKKITKDTEIKAEGRLVRMGKQELFIAKKLKVDGEVVKIDRSKQQKSMDKAKSS